MALELVKPSLQVFSLSSALFLSGYHYGSDAVALPNTLTSSSISAEDAVRSWYRAWDVGRVVGPVAVNGAMIGFGVLAFLEGRGSPSFSAFSIASTTQFFNVIYTVFGVFKVNDLLLAEYEKIKMGKECARKEKIAKWVEDWKVMDRKRMFMMNITALAGLIGLWWK